MFMDERQIRTSLENEKDKFVRLRSEYDFTALEIKEASGALSDDDLANVCGDVIIPFIEQVGI